MLKFTGLIGSALASLVIIPTATLDGVDSDSPTQSLEIALTQTVEALDLLAGIRQESEAGRAVSTIAVREISEAPIAEDRDRDERLQLIRTQVSLLQQELDILESRRLDADTGASFHNADTSGKDSLGVTKGLEARTLDQIRGLQKPNAKQQEEVPSAEHPGYSANSLLQGQACYRAGQFKRGALLLRGDESAAGRYWLARCLERGGSLKEASEIYRALTEDEDAVSFAERAKTNLEFVEWKALFVEKLPEAKQR